MTKKGGGKNGVAKATVGTSGTGTSLLGVQRTRASTTEILGTSGAEIFHGWPRTKETDPRLGTGKRWETYSEAIANVAIVGASIRYFLNLVAGVKWKAEPPEGSGARGRELADRFIELLYDMRIPWHRVVRRAAMHRVYGFSIAEWTAEKKKDGTIGFLEVATRPQSTIEQWDVDEHGAVLGVVQRSPTDSRTIYLPRAKLLYVVDDSLSDQPEGMGAIRHAIKTALSLERYELLEAWGFETDMRGIPVARAPRSEMSGLIKADLMTADDQAKAEKGLRDFCEKHIKNPELALFLDSATYRSLDEAQTPGSIYKWGVELLKGEPAGLEEMAKAIDRKERQIARIFGTEHMLLGDGAGSHALSRDKTTNLAQVVDGTLLEIAETVETDLATIIYRLNGWPLELLPTITTDKVRLRDVEQVTTALEQMSRAGAPIMPSDPVVNDVRDLLGVSRAPEMSDAEAAALPGSGGRPPGEEGGGSEGGGGEGDDEEVPAGAGTGPTGTRAEE